MKSSNKMKNRNLDIYFDILRIIACFLVIVNHTNSSVLLSEKPSLIWFVSLTYFFVCKIAVPIYFMISGALLLKKSDDFKKSLERVLRVLLVIFIFSFIYYLNDCYLLGKSFSLINYFKTIYSKSATNAYWYLYTYLGLMVTLPILQSLVKSLSREKMVYFLIISFIFLGTMPVLIHYYPSLNYNHDFMLYMFDPIIGYFLAGYFIDKYVEPTKKKTLIAYIVFVLSIVLSVVLTYFEYKKNNSQFLFFDNRSTILIIASSVSFFYLVRYYFKKGFSERLNNIIHYVGGLTFGIYLLSDFFIQKYTFVGEFMYNNGINKMIVLIFFEILVFVTGMLVTLILKKIPGLNKLL